MTRTQTQGHQAAATMHPRGTLEPDCSRKTTPAKLVMSWAVLLFLQRRECPPAKMSVLEKVRRLAGHHLPCRCWMEGKVTPSPAPITHRQARMTYTDSVEAATGVRMVKADQTTTPNPRMSLAVNLVARYPPHMFVTV